MLHFIDFIPNDIREDTGHAMFSHLANQGSMDWKGGREARSEKRRVSETLW